MSTQKPSGEGVPPVISSATHAIRDPTLYQWLFFVQLHSREKEGHRKDHFDGFWTVLGEAFEWSGQRAPAVPSAPPAFSTQTTERIASTGRQDRDGATCEVEARSLLDALYLLVVQARLGPLDHATRPLPWSSAKVADGSAAHAFIDQAFCLCGEIDDELDDNSLNAVIGDLGSWLKSVGGVGREPEWIPLSCGLLAPMPDAASAAVAFLYPFSKKAEAGRFVSLLLPQLLLSWVKGKRISAHYRDDLLPIARRQEETLEELRADAAKRELTLEEVENVSVSLAREHSVFLENVSEIEDRLQTVKVNARNAELILEEPVWGEEKSQARRVLVDWMALLAEQMETDIVYLRITGEQDKLVLDSLGIVTGARTAQSERRIALLLGLLAVTGVAQAAQDLDWWWQLAAAALAAVVVAGTYWWFLWKRGRGGRENQK